ncbi:hypothetical protein PC116_g25856 [Phytophthora cactorum]|uniref:Uncharacterized protein n=1 Tax=Phytophthora cactorum TaxID=29920 RepID=A0A8T1C8P5_9STRA|nr:hypothetical protein PC114_g18799 [Phytophthora cactorum]KAG2914823.1 hypothetical protein PC117_g18204 [Phytophthora cactorum]KAG2969384.1 hypothetical protein PC119_g23933 [Phytophthora cactorum]KAG3142427.1 hypothetical protein C6341_g19431 [Phytophthora cactorum]KAG3166824.1 hypothetical protein PC128_g19636 [Phytophthora cactorum]
MKSRVDVLAITELSCTARHVWELVHREFYDEAAPDLAIVGLTRKQVISRVLNTRRNHYGGEVHGRLEIPPLSLVKNSTLRFCKFHHVYYEDMQRKPNKPQRIIGIDPSANVRWHYDLRGC